MARYLSGVARAQCRPLFDFNASLISTVLEDDFFDPADARADNEAWRPGGGRMPADQKFVIFGVSLACVAAVSAAQYPPAIYSSTTSKGRASIRINGDEVFAAPAACLFGGAAGARQGGTPLGDATYSSYSAGGDVALGDAYALIEDGKVIINSNEDYRVNLKFGSLTTVAAATVIFCLLHGIHMQAVKASD